MGHHPQLLRRGRRLHDTVTREHLGANTSCGSVGVRSATLADPAVNQPVGGIVGLQLLSATVCDLHRGFPQQQALGRIQRIGPTGELFANQCLHVQRRIESSQREPKPALTTGGSMTSPGIAALFRQGREQPGLESHHPRLLEPCDLHGNPPGLSTGINSQTGPTISEGIDAAAGGRNNTGRLDGESRKAGQIDNRSVGSNSRHDHLHPIVPVSQLDLTRMHVQFLERTQRLDLLGRLLVSNRTNRPGCDHRNHQCHHAEHR